MRKDRMTGNRKAVRESAGQALVLACALLVIAVAAGLVTMIMGKGTAAFRGTHLSLWDFLAGTVWNPERSAGRGGPAVGALPFIAGTASVSMLAMCLAAPVGVGAAIFISEMAPGWGERVLRPATELFLGIPSVVYGWVGLSTIVPFVRQHLGGLGFSVLSGGLVLSVMILPTIVSISTDALKGVPGSLREAAYSLGSTRWQVVRRVLLPAAASGIMTSMVLALARAFGEALAVQMVIGNVRLVPGSILSPAATLTSAIAMDMGNTVNGSLWNNALWTMAAILLLMSLGFTLLVRLVSRSGRKGGVAV